VRGAMYPVAAQSYRSMQKMKEVGPKMKELQARYKDDPTKLQGEMMAFYRKEKVNPMAGCLPMLIQIPIFFSLYKVLYVTLEMRHAPFFGIYRDLSAPDPTNLFTLFGLLPFTPPAFLHIGILPLLLGLSTWLQMKLNPAPTDETQKQVFAMMPWLMTFMMIGFPAGLLFYWIFSNLLSIVQQWWMTRAKA
jgi:YidC/Oxa1 family membrane protein insertase